jgi:hypothetical protein
MLIVKLLEKERKKLNLVSAFPHLSADLHCAYTYTSLLMSIVVKTRINESEIAQVV